MVKKLRVDVSIYTKPGAQSIVMGRQSLKKVASEVIWHEWWWWMMPPNNTRRRIENFLRWQRDCWWNSRSSKYKYFVHRPCQGVKKVWSQDRSIDDLFWDGPICDGGCSKSHLILLWALRYRHHFVGATDSSARPHHTLFEISRKRASRQVGFFAVFWTMHATGQVYFTDGKAQIPRGMADPSPVSQNKSYSW